MAISKERLRVIATLGGVEISEMASRLLALEWSPITESNLPRAGDEVGFWDSCCDDAGLFWYHRSVDRTSELLGDDYVAIADMTVEWWTELEFTHRRQLNAPITPAEGEK